jgi:hypothetical protein
MCISLLNLARIGESLRHVFSPQASSWGWESQALAASSPHSFGGDLGLAGLTVQTGRSGEPGEHSKNVIYLYIYIYVYYLYKQTHGYRCMSTHTMCTFGKWYRIKDNICNWNIPVCILQLFTSHLLYTYSVVLLYCTRKTKVTISINKENKTI